MVSIGGEGAGRRGAPHFYNEVYAYGTCYNKMASILGLLDCTCIQVSESPLNLSWAACALLYTFLGALKIGVLYAAA